MPWRNLRVLTLLLGLVAAAPARAEAPGARPELRVLAAASLTDVVNALAGRFEAAVIVASFGASSELARQAADGVPGDVFLSASPEWTDFLAQKGALAGAAQTFAGNSLICIAPRGSRLAAAGVKDLATLARATRSDDRIAIADAGVPAGEYARQSLEKLGLLQTLTPRLVGQKDVRAVLHAVETGEVVAGFAYATDARAAAVEVLFPLDPKSHAPIVYPAAVLRQSRHPELARAFLEFLRSAAAREVLAGAGFTLP